VRRLVIFVAILAIFIPVAASAQAGHEHVLPVNAVAGGVPYFCAEPTAIAVTSGRWSNPATWSTNAVPGRDARVLIAAGREIVYDVERDATLRCIELHGRLAFSTDVSTKMNIVHLVVMPEGALEVGTADRRVDPTVTARIEIADEPLDQRVDPGQVGNGIVGLGRVTMHGAVKTPTFLRLAAQARAGDTTLTLERPVSGWAPGDRIVIPDTRQLRGFERQSQITPRDETVEIVSIAGADVTVKPALEYDHIGGRDSAAGRKFLPHVGNVSRNVILGSERSTGTRGHMIFLGRADVDLRYVEVRDMGRTRMGVLDNTTFDAGGRVLRVGTNQIGRYAIHFHHNFGPASTPANGHQFTLIGNAVTGPTKWGITVHNTHHGLVAENVVFDARGAAIVTEDGTESFNVFDHNFTVHTQGVADATPRGGGYGGGPGPEPGGEGSGFWFSGPNNYVRNNVAASADVFGFSLAGSIGTVRIPAAKGADTTTEAGTHPFDTAASPVLEFAGNEAYGALQVGVDCGWNGVVSNFVVWNAARHGVVGTPSRQLVIDGLVVRGEPALLADRQENPTGVWLGDYLAKQIVIRNADIEGLRTGISSPFVVRSLATDPSRDRGAILIENSRFRNYFGVVVGTAYTAQSRGEQPLKQAVVRASTFETLTEAPVDSANPPAAISMNYRMAPGDSEPREPILVYDYNGKPGDTFKLYYSLDAPPHVAPCHESRPDIAGWACRAR
jgi:hypothetical protein